MSRPSLIPKRRPGLEHAVEDSAEVAVFDERGERLLVLDDAGAAVWLLVNGRRSTREIAAIVQRVLPVEPSAVQDVIETFLGVLASRGLIEFVSAFEQLDGLPASVH